MTDRERISQALPLVTEWYRLSQRVLPWREDPTPYHVWISEIMLQQTRIEAVIPYYRRFLEALPGIPELAAVDEDRLLKLWEGLGYYSRARNLKKAAERILTDFGGELPHTAAQLKILPGIGEYTAGAIASIAYGQPSPAVDGNVLRVIARLLVCPEDVMEPGTRLRISRLLETEYPSGESAALLTEGLMELGETVCIPNGIPKCQLCPLRSLCLAHAAGSQENYPVKAPKKERRRELRTVLLLRCGEHWAIRRREEKGLLEGMWEFPGVTGELGEEEIRALGKDFGLEIRSCRPCGKAKHLFTHVEWHMQGWLVDCAGESGDFLWKTREEIRADYPVPTALRAFQKIVTEA